MSQIVAISLLVSAVFMNVSVFALDASAPPSSSPRPMADAVPQTPVAELADKQALPEQKAAQTTYLPNRSFRITLEMPVVGVYHFREKNEEEGRENKNTLFEAGIGDSRDSGYHIPRFKLGLGGQVAPRLVVGANVNLVFAPVKTDLRDEGNAGGYNASFGVMPFVEGILSSNNRIVPFVRGSLGFRMDMSKSEYNMAFSDPFTVTYKRKSPHLVWGAAAGVHVFVIPRCSIDFLIQGSMHIGTNRSEMENMPQSADGTNYLDEEKTKSIRIIGDALAGISVWI
ncbi:MAG: hypothetical protein JXX14_00875 [Deltaproteobacteria bacterium]|nr:hypothetical protein [Deltaproteobacteria bacterium]